MSNQHDYANNTNQQNVKTLSMMISNTKNQNIKINADQNISIKELIAQKDDPNNQKPTLFHHLTYNNANQSNIQQPV
jgi:hypothetical protein